MQQFFIPDLNIGEDDSCRPIKMDSTHISEGQDAEAIDCMSDRRTDIPHQHCKLKYINLNLLNIRI